MPWVGQAHLNGTESVACPRCHESANEVVVTIYHLDDAQAYGAMISVESDGVAQGMAALTSICCGVPVQRPKGAGK